MSVGGVRQDQRCCKGKIPSFGDYLQINNQGNARKKDTNVTKILVDYFETEPVIN